MLRSVRMKRFYLAVLQKHENEVAELLGSLGFVHLEKKKSEIRREAIEAEEYLRFIREINRLKSLINIIERHVRKRKARTEKLREVKTIFKTPDKKKPEIEKITKEEFEKSLKDLEEVTERYRSKIDELTKKLDDLRKLKIDLECFRRNGVKLDTLGECTHTIEKAGFIPVGNVSKLIEYLRPFDIVYSLLKGRPKENLLLIAFSEKDKEEIDKILSLLNFEEFKLPSDLNPDPTKAIQQLEERELEIIKMLEKLKEEVKKEIEKYERALRYIRFLYTVKASILRTRNLTIFDGWVPAENAKILEEKVKELTDGVMYIRFRDPEEDEKPPTYIKNPPILNKFELLTFKRGIPDYNEIDPTPIYTALFVIMYGMIFGDIGQGAVLLALGLMLNKIRKPLLGISASGINKLGTIMAVSSIPSIIFGFLYGEFFLHHIFEPLWINPLNNIMDIIVISLIFGLFQIIIGIILNIMNLILKKEYFHAIFNWKGVIGLVYYISGVYLAVQFIIGGTSFSVFLKPENVPVLITALSALGLIFLSPTIILLLDEKKKEPLSISIVMGFAEFLEGFISYLTNSISYVRLGAFAVAHAALGETAAILSSSMGAMGAYILMNVLVIMMEGFAAGIQSLRLIYYEFSTKFYKGTGKAFKPLRF